MKKPKKKTMIKYFDPVEIDKLWGNMDQADLEGSFGYFALDANKKSLFLNRISKEQINKMMNDVGLVKYLKNKGFDNLIIEIDKDESQIHYLKIYFDKISVDNLLIDLRLSESKFLPRKRFFDDDAAIPTYDMVIIEWLMAQNPKGRFDPNRPQLPGQTRPGLGVLRYMMDLMYYVGKQVVKDGFMDVPDHFHGAVMYSKKFKFFNPAHEAILHAILRDCKGYSLVDLSWGMITQTIIEVDSQKPQIYDPSEQIFPVSKRMKDYFKSKKYKEKYKYTLKLKKYYFDYDKMIKLRDEIIKNKRIEDL